MTLCRIFLAMFFAVLVVYTLILGSEHGWSLFSMFFREIQSMTWQGQFNLNFLGLLLLAAFWCGWRNDFSAFGWGLAVLGATGGILFLAIYLLYLSFQTRGDITTMMLGERRAPI